MEGLPTERSQSHSEHDLDPQTSTNDTTITSTSDQNNSSTITGEHAGIAVEEKLTGSHSTSNGNDHYEDDDVKKCWICFADETEDLPDSAPNWRSPCPCALVAHEKCLLTWISEVENPKKGQFSNKILCPQCKSQIHLSGRSDPIVNIVRKLRTVASIGAFPATLGGAGLLIQGAFKMHGVHSIYMIFGQNDAWRILEPLLRFRWYAEGSSLATIGRLYLQHWRLHFGIPLITPMLILSRTSLADKYLPLIPLAFLATTDIGKTSAGHFQWPSSAACAFAVLPYLRILYNQYYATVWRAHEKRWMEEVMPSGEQDGNDNNNNNDNNDNNNNNNAGVGQPELVIEAEIHIEEEDIPNVDNINNENGQAAVNADERPIQRIIANPDVGRLGFLAENNARRRDQLERLMTEVDNQVRARAERLRTSSNINELPLDPLPEPGQLSALERVAVNLPASTANEEMAGTEDINARLNEAMDNMDNQEQELQQLMRNAMANEAAMADLAQQLEDGQREIARVAALPAARELPRARVGVPVLSRLSDAVIGSLLFPTIASISGELLKLALPKTWSTPAISLSASSILQPLFGKTGRENPITAILQKKWGRSLVGGCLFVVLKDVIMLYVKWKVAVQHRNRKVLNYDKVKKKVVE